MDQLLKALREQIQKLPLGEEQRQEVLSNLEPMILDKQKRLSFMERRTLKDKNIVINLLNQAIEDLKKQQKEVRRKNEILEEQKLLLEAQSRQLRESLERLEMSYEELEQFSYIASHDLKSPLRTIASYAQLLQRRYQEQLDDNANDFLEYIVNGAHQMNNIIKDLLAYSGVQGSTGQFVPVDLNLLLDQVRFNLHTEIEETQAVIQTANLPGKLRSSQSGMLQLLQNLVSNAIKFRGSERPLIYIAAHRKSDHWQFEVQDNGIGLDENYRDKAFLPFQRMSDRSLPGSGIGLAICKKVVKLHRGQIWYESRLGKGTTFYFTIPVY